MKDEKKGHSYEFERQRQAEEAIQEYEAVAAKLEKLRNGRPRVELSEDELAARWRHLMQSGKFLDEE